MGDRINKTQQRRLYESIISKAYKATMQFSAANHTRRMSLSDLATIEKICNKYLKKF